MNIVFQISAYNDANKIETLVKFLSAPLEQHIITILVHINKLSCKTLHEKMYDIERKYQNVHIISPIIVKWSHISHVEQKIKGLLYLKNNDIKYDYYICITESDIPIKPLDKIVNFISENASTSFFFDISKEDENMLHYHEAIGILKGRKRISSGLSVLYNEIYLSDYSLTHKWRWYFYPRNLRESKDLSKITKIILKILRNLSIMLRLFSITKYLIKPTNENFLKAQKWQFGKKIKNQTIPICSEWQFSITSFFSKQYCDFIIENWDKYIDQFRFMYAPDESFWISIANNFDTGKCEFNWKPLILGISTYMKSKDGSELKASWNYNDFSTVSQYNSSCELFARKANSYEHMISLMKYLKIR